MWPSVLSHVLPVTHAAGGDALLTLGLLTAGVLVSSLVGLVVANELTCRAQRSVLAALSAGMLLFLLFDLFKESAGLGQAFLARPFFLLALVGAYAAGFLLVPFLGREEASTRLAWAWAFGVSLHGMAEGYILGTEGASADLTRVAGTASFLLHKGMEAFTIPILLTFGMGRGGTLQAALLLAGTTLLGAVLGLVLGSTLVPLVLFASGAGAVSIVMLRLARDAAPTTRSAAWALAGVLLVYAAGLLHELG